MKKSALLLTVLLVGCSEVEAPKTQDVAMQQYCKLSAPDNSNACLVEEEKTLRKARKMVTLSIAKGKTIFPDPGDLWGTWPGALEDIDKCEKARLYSIDTALIFFNCMRAINDSISKETLELKLKNYNQMKLEKPGWFK